MYNLRILRSTAIALIVLSCSANEHTIEMHPPPAPGALSAVAVSESEIGLMWESSAVVFDGFIVEESVSDSFHFQEITRITSDRRYFNIGQRDFHTEYFYRILCYNDAGNSEPSNIAFTSTANAPPAAPSNLTGEIYFGVDIHLKWDDNSRMEKGCEVHAFSEDQSDFLRVAVTDTNETEYILENQVEETVFRLKVRSYNHNGFSEFSNEIMVTTQIEPLYLDLYPLSGSGTVQLNTNYYLGCTLERHTGEKVGGRTVHFTADPDNSGSITRWAKTSLDSSNGFETTVVYFGRLPGEIIIEGQVRNDTGVPIASDTLHVHVLED